MPTVIATDLPTIMAATEQKLLTFVSSYTTDEVIGDITNVFWVYPGDEPKPGTVGQRDILLVEHLDDTNGNVVGAGRFTWMYSGIDVNLRSSYAADKHGTRKDWLIAHRVLINHLLDALMGFFPVDANNNALTIEGFVLDQNSSPNKARDSLTWGQTVCTFRFHYVPTIDHLIIG